MSITIMLLTKYMNEISIGGNSYLLLKNLNNFLFHCIKPIS